MNARSARLDRLWMARAINSLPVPVSPRIKTVESEEATFATWRSTLRSASEEPTMSSNIESRSICSRNARFSLRVLSSARTRSSMSVPVAYQRITSSFLVPKRLVTNQEPAILTVFSQSALLSSNGAPRAKADFRYSRSLSRSSGWKIRSRKPGCNNIFH